MNIRSEKLFKIVSVIIFVMYLLLAVWVIIFKCNMMFSIKLGYYSLSEMTLSERLLREINPIGWYINPPIKSQVPYYLRDDILNVFLFVPFGLYLSCFIKNRKILKTVIIAFLTSLFLEVFQVLTLLGAGSTKDLITNTLGAFIGCLIYKKIYSVSRMKLFNVCSIVVLIFTIPLFLYALVNTISNIDVYISIVNRTL